MGEFECVQMTRKFQGDGIDTYALKPINLKFKTGDFVSVIGPSGSGNRHS